MRILAIILFAACGSRDAEAPSSAERSSGQPGQAAQTRAGEEPAETPVDPGPVPVVDLQSVEDDGVSLRLRVPGPEAVELRRSVRIERDNDGTWEAVDSEFSLRADCQESSTGEGTCLTLAAGAELISPSIGSDSGQCGAAELAAGSYRFVVQSCAPDDARPHELHSAFTLTP